MDATPRRIALRVQYDGTDFHGWAVQSGLRTVPGTLIDTVRKALDPTAEVDGASRTDAGVHARSQLAAVTLAHPIQPRGLVKALNARLPADVSVLSAWEVPANFQPRFESRGKTYTYRFYRSHAPHPLIERYAWRVPQVLDVDAMRAAAAHLLGTHDFLAFAATDLGQPTSVRTMWRFEFDADATRMPWQLAVTVEGNAFLKQMVRNLAGTFYDVGRGLLAPEAVPVILASLDRRRAGPTAPARGLTLERVWYDDP